MGDARDHAWEIFENFLVTPPLTSITIGCIYSSYLSASVHNLILLWKTQPWWLQILLIQILLFSRCSKKLNLLVIVFFFSEVCVVNHQNLMRINYPFEFLARQNTKLKEGSSLPSSSKTANWSTCFGRVEDLCLENSLDMSRWFLWILK